MPRSIISPLDAKVPIVDPDTGSPTLQLLRLWQQMFGNEAGTHAVATTTAAEVADKADKDINIIAGVALSGGGDLSNDLTIDAILATDVEIQAGAVADKLVTPDALFDAMAPETITDGATINWDMALILNGKVTLGGNRTFAAPTNPRVGMSYALEVIQDATGSRTMTWNAAFDWGSIGAPTLSTGVNKRDIIFMYCYDAAAPKFRSVVSLSA